MVVSDLRVFGRNRADMVSERPVEADVQHALARRDGVAHDATASCVLLASAVAITRKRNGANSSCRTHVDNLPDRRVTSVFAAPTSTLVSGVSESSSARK